MDRLLNVASPPATLFPRMLQGSFDPGPENFCLSEPGHAPLGTGDVCSLTRGSSLSKLSASVGRTCLDDTMGCSSTLPQPISLDNAVLIPNLLEGLCVALAPLLVVSDPHECNNNLSQYLQMVVDYLKPRDQQYHACLVLALQLIGLNLFAKNVRLCLGKILGLFSAFAATDSPTPETLALREILLVILLLLLKLCGSDDSDLQKYTSSQDLMDCLYELRYVQIWARFTADHVRGAKVTHKTYVLLKFNCDAFFNYLYQKVLLADDEFDFLARCLLVPALIDHLLSNDNFNNYDLAGADFDDVSKLVAYEEFKLLLLINEQYMMRAASSQCPNHVIEGLLQARSHVANGICGFTNLLVYHMNREESHIIKILMLKFLYLCFTSQKVARLAYLNDLKILVDIIIRELNDLDYSSLVCTQESLILAHTLFKVLHPLLVHSQLADSIHHYKTAQLNDLLTNVVANCDSAPTSIQSSYQASIVKMAMKCLRIPWLRPKKQKPLIPHSLSSSAESLALSPSYSSKTSLSERTDSTISNDTHFPRMASVRASSKSDYNKHTTSHNLELESDQENIFEANNLNVFQRTRPSQVPRPDSYYISHCPTQKEAVGLLDLPKEYLMNKSLPKLPPEAREDPVTPKPSDPIQCIKNHAHDVPRKVLSPEPPEHSHILARKNEGSAKLLEKARQKKAPPPPPPPPRRRR